MKRLRIIAQGEDFVQDEAAATLLTADCQKIFNGTLYTKSRHAFVADLLEVNRNQGCWTVSPVDTICSLRSKEVVLRLMIEMESGGCFTALVILRFNADNLIYEINEVFSKIEGSYNF